MSGLSRVRHQWCRGYTRTDFFLLRCCPRSLRSARFKNLVGGNRTKCTSILTDFLRRVFLPLSQKTPIRTSSEQLGCVVRSVARRVPEPRSRSSGNTSDKKTGACSHGFNCTNRTNIGTQCSDFLKTSELTRIYGERGSTSNCCLWLPVLICSAKTDALLV